MTNLFGRIDIAISTDHATALIEMLCRALGLKRVILQHVIVGDLSERDQTSSRKSEFNVTEKHHPQCMYLLSKIIINYKWNKSKLWTKKIERYNEPNVRMMKTLIFVIDSFRII